MRLQWRYLSLLYQLWLRRDRAEEVVEFSRSSWRLAGRHYRSGLRRRGVYYGWFGWEWVLSLGGVEFWCMFVAFVYGYFFFEWSEFEGGLKDWWGFGGCDSSCWVASDENGIQVRDWFHVMLPELWHNECFTILVWGLIHTVYLVFHSTKYLVWHVSHVWIEYLNGTCLQKFLDVFKVTGVSNGKVQAQHLFRTQQSLKVIQSYSPAIVAP